MEVPEYKYLSPLRRLDEETHILDRVWLASPLFEEAERHMRFKQYVDQMITRIATVQEHWTPEHGGSSWQDYVQLLYSHAWEAHDLGERRTNMVIADMGAGALVYFTKISGK